MPLFRGFGVWGVSKAVRGSGLHGQMVRCRPTRRPQEGGSGRERWERPKPQVRVRRGSEDGNVHQRDKGSAGLSWEGT